MTKADFVAAVAAKTCSTKKDAEAAVEAVLDVITETLASGTDVQFIGFGTFKVTAKPEREGRHPATGDKIKIPASNAISFKVGSKLKESVNVKVETPKVEAKCDSKPMSKCKTKK